MQNPFKSKNRRVEYEAIEPDIKEDIPEDIQISKEDIEAATPIAKEVIKQMMPSKVKPILTKAEEDKVPVPVPFTPQFEPTEEQLYALFDRYMQEAYNIIAYLKQKKVR